MTSPGSGRCASPEVEAEAEQFQQTPPAIVIGAAKGGTGMKPPLQSFSSPTAGLQTPFSNQSSSSQQDSITGHQVPQDASTPSHIPSALSVDALQPDAPQPKLSEATDNIKLIDNFNNALKKACEAGKALQECCKKKRCETDPPSFNSDTDEGNCSKELKDYRESCSKLFEYERHLKEAYEEEYKTLKACLEAMKDKERAKSMEHKLEMDQVQRSHNEEVRELQETIHMQAEYQALCDLQYHASEVAELNKLKNNYKAQQKEVEKLRNTLAEKEKTLHKLGDKISAMETELKHRSLLCDEEYTKNQLQRCEQISKLVSQLPSIRSGKEMDKLVEEIFKETANMKKTSSRSTSWRR